MNYLRRSEIYLRRNPGKVFTLFSIIFVLGSFISGAISLNRAIENTKMNLLSRFPAVVGLHLNWRELAEAGVGFWDSLPEGTVLSSSLAEKIGDLPYVTAFDIGLLSTFPVTDLQPYFVPDSPFREFLEEIWRESGAGFDFSHSFQTRGVKNIYHLEFMTGFINVVEGRFFNGDDKYVAIISSELANANNLGLGSFLTLESTQTNHIEVEIVGLFDLAYPIQSEDWEYNINRTEQLFNQIYLPFDLIEFTIFDFYESEDWDLANQLQQEEMGLPPMTLENLLFLQPIYYLRDIRYLESFAEITQRLLPPFWEITDYSYNFSPLLISFENLLNISHWILWGAIGASVVIISLLLILYLRERKQEVGIYRAFGEKSWKIILQFLLEILIIGGIALNLALFTGNILSTHLSREMLRQDLMQETDVIHSRICVGCSIDGMAMLNTGELSPEAMLASFDTSLDAYSIILFYSLSVLVILISTVLPVIYLLKFQPKQILL